MHYLTFLSVKQQTSLSIQQICLFKGINFDSEDASYIITRYNEDSWCSGIKPIISGNDNVINIEHEIWLFQTFYLTFLYDNETNLIERILILFIRFWIYFINESLKEILFLIKLEFLQF